MSNDSQLLQKKKKKKKYNLFTCSIFLELQEFIADILQSGSLLGWNSYPLDSCCYTKIQSIMLRVMSRYIILCHMVLLRTSFHSPSPSWWCFFPGEHQLQIQLCDLIHLGTWQSLMGLLSNMVMNTRWMLLSLRPLLQCYGLLNSRKKVKAEGLDYSFKSWGLHFHFIPQLYTSSPVMQLSEEKE